MMENNLSQLGYLMKLLNVSATDLSEYLKIERTTVSKWKSGARPLLESSSYYKKVLVYLAEKNEQHTEHVLYGFFRNIDRDANPINSKDIIACIAQFLKGTELPMSAKYFLSDSKNALYQANFSVYRGVEGRKAAVSLLFSIAEELSKPCTICMLESDQYEWATSDMGYLELLGTRLEKLLNKGHKVEIIHLLNKDLPAYRLLLRKFLPISFHPNLKQYSLKSKFDRTLSMGIYGIRDFFVATAMGGNDRPSNLYTSVYHDIVTINQTLGMFENFKQYVSPIVISNKKADKDMILSAINAQRNQEKPLCYTGNMLSFVTMSEPLFLEILEQNRISASQKQQCLNLYRSLKTSMESRSSHGNNGFFFYVDEVMEGLMYDSLVQYELSAFMRNNVIMTKQQYLRHFKDTAGYLRSNPQIKTVITHGARLYDAIACTWFQQDEWCLSINVKTHANMNRILFTQDPFITKMYTNDFEDFYQKACDDHKSNTIIANLFESISGEKRFG